MKKFLGLCIIIVMLVIASGCTQPAAQTTPTPTPAATAAPTAAPTAEQTMPQTPAETTIVPAETTAAPEVTTNVTAEVTAEVTTAATPKVSATPSTKVTTIYIRNGSFVPKELTVLPGTGITWMNEDNVVHQVKTLPDIGIKFTSADLVPGASFGYTFGANEGTYGYIDTYTNATGMIIVKKGEAFYGAPSVQPTATTAATQ